MTTASSNTDASRPAWLTDAAWPHPVRHVNADGVAIAYTDVGTGPTLLFVHVGMWSILWRDVIHELHGRYRCVTLDAPGCGLSERPAGKLRLDHAAAAVSAVVDELDLTDITLIVHDLGTPAALHAAAAWTDRIAALCVINGFGWRPTGPMFRGMLATMGNPIMREFDAATGWLPRASATRFGVGRHWKRATRKTYRRGLRRPQRRTFHRYMNAARHHDPWDQPTREPGVHDPSGPGQPAGRGSGETPVHRRRPEPVVGHGSDLCEDSCRHRVRVFHHRRVLPNDRGLAGRGAYADLDGARSVGDGETVTRWAPAPGTGHAFRCGGPVHVAAFH